MAESRNALSCAVCAKSASPEEARLVLALDTSDGDARPFVENVVVVCEGACIDDYSRPGSKLLAQRLNEPDPQQMLQALMRKFRWSHWAFEPFIAILAAIEVERRQTAPQKRLG